jgi:hypothetical protein
VDAELDPIELEDEDADGVLHLVQLRDSLELGLCIEGQQGGGMLAEGWSPLRPRAGAAKGGAWPPGAGAARGGA